VNDPLFARFAEACGATGPLDLRVGLAGSGVLAEGTVRQPFTVVGRDDACEVTLNDPDVHLRHAWLQVIDGRVFATDLGGRTGLVWPSGATGSGWLDPGAVLTVGPFRLSLRAPVSDRPLAPRPNPLQADPTRFRTGPAVQLEFRNGKRPRDRWTVNRAVTLVGRADVCKLHLTADDIAAYHCGLVHTPTGLWVVDLSGRGVVVDGERMRVAPLPHGAELWVGRFRIGCRYPAPGGGAVRITADPPTSAGGPRNTAPDPRTQVMPIRAVVAEDEVPLGGLPPPDPMAGLPSSHIMRDVFRPVAASDRLSAPILLGAPGPDGSAGEPGDDRPAAPPGGDGTPALPDESDAATGALLRHLADVHAQMFEQLQQTLLLLAQVCGQVRQGRTAAVRQELNRIRELNRELARLQAEVVRLALDQGAVGPDATDAGLADRTNFPLASLPGGDGRKPDANDAIHDWVRERIGAIQQERQSRWRNLVGLFADGEAAG
jgi:hypothetical protein